MFSLKIIDTDLFLDMPVTARLLYYDLSMRADDDGFVASPKKIQRMIGCSDDDMKLLTAKQFIIPFDNGICVIKHWRIHNYIRVDRHIDTIYQIEKQQLIENNGAYELNVIPSGNQMSDNRYPQVRLGKDSISKNINNISASDAQLEELWKLYPEKKGKAKAIKKIPSLIKKYGFKQIQRCIGRYKQYVESRRKSDFPELKYQNGSTFFNGTYLDYLDENWKEDINGYSSNDKADKSKFDWSKYGG